MLFKKQKTVQSIDYDRFTPSSDVGLISSQVEKRKTENLLNYDVTIPTKSYSKIVFSNVFTLFNLINVILVLLIIFKGDIKNGLFIFTVVINTSIAIIQEIRSKKTIDKLSLLAVTKVKTVRDGEIVDIGMYDLVLDDIVILSTGDQVPSDCIIINGHCEVNESLLTGEADAITKRENDELLSGSFIVSGNCRARVNKVSEGNFVYSILKGAKYIKETQSEIVTSLKKIIRFVTVLIIPIGIGFYFSQRFRSGLDEKQAITSVVAALIGMIPEGLILLTSTVFAISVVKLAKHKVMIQDLYCAEILARVDMLCLDKTGTITEGSMEVENIYSTKSYPLEELNTYINAFSKFQTDSNPTIDAIKNHYQDKETSLELDKIISFSSKKKWSGIRLKTGESIVVGAAEFVFKKYTKVQSEKINELSQENRVLVIGISKQDFIDENTVPKDLKLMGYIAIRDKIRKEAPATLKFFDQQGVGIKIISGDNVITVSNIAKRAGVKNYDKYIDMSTLTDEREIEEAAIKYTVFGRVTPNQKKILVKALKDHGHTVAMTGDGVNDVLALKESDCSIAMASGSDAAKNVAQLVLLDSNFASLPKVVAEGRQSINNLQMSGSLFLVKTFYSIFLTAILLIFGKPYPIISLQLTLIGGLTIGIPGFLLALQKNEEILKGKFMSNVGRKSVPGALAILIGVIIAVFGLAEYRNLILNGTLQSAFSSDNIQILNDNILNITKTVSFFVIAGIHFIFLFDVSRPFNIKKNIINISLVLIFVAAIFIMRDFKGNNLIEIYDFRSDKMVFVILSIALSASLAVYLVLRELASNRFMENLQKKLLQNMKRKL